MRKHFLILMLLTLLPFAGWAEEAQNAVTLLTGATLSQDYNGTVPTFTVKATSDGDALEGTWATTDGVLSDDGAPTAAAGTYKWTEAVQSGTAKTATYVIRKAQIVYYLTGRTYAVGDAPDITNHYSKASGEFIGEDKLENFATFDFATSGNDALDLDENKRFTKIKTYNITALRVIEKPVHQNYDFRFTSTAVIVVTAKSIAGFLADPVADQTYTGSQITFDANALPKIYANEADKTAHIALGSSNYDVKYGKNINVVYTTPEDEGVEPEVTYGGTIIYEGKGNYEGTLEIPFKILPHALKSVTVDAIADTTFTHENIEPELVVKGKDAQNVEFILTSDDYEVSYLDNEEKPTNFNAGIATGKLTIKGGNFKTATNATVQNASFEIKPKSLADEKIKLTGSINKTYTGAALTQNTTGSGDNAIAVKWTIAENNVIDLTSILTYTYENNTGVGKATIKAEPNTNTDSEASLEEEIDVNSEIDVNPESDENPANYTGFTSAFFDILPTDLVTANVTISLKKRNAQVEDEDAENAWIDATYQYEGRNIEPGKKDADGNYADGKVVVMNGETELVEGEDYEIVSYGDDMETIKGDNKNASVTPEEGDDESVVKTRGTVTIQGLGNYGAINTLAEPIKMSTNFEIAKRTVVLNAKAIETTFGVSPESKFAYESNIVEKDAEGNQMSAEKLLGGVVTYKVESKANDATDFSDYEGELTALQVTQEGNTIYQYYPVMMSLPATAQGEAEAEAPVAGVDYVSEAQIAARANYIFPVFGEEDEEGEEEEETGVIGVPAAIIVNVAKWIIVPDNQSKKYGVADAALTFTYKVYDGEYDAENPEENLVAEPQFDENSAPVVGRLAAHAGENVVNGGYTISVLNADEDLTIGETTKKKVAKTGYEMEFKTATLTINPFPITVTANDQTIIYGSEANLEAKEDSKVKIVTDGVETDGTQLTVTFTPVMFGNQSLITREMLNLSLDVEEGYEGKVGEYELIPAIDNHNFAATIVPGKLTVVAGNIMVLGRTDAKCKDEIIAHNGGQGVTVKFETRELKAETWQAMAFPFELTVAEFSNAIYKATNGKGYAVVNILNEENTTDKPAFKLWMREIPANTPFLFKVYNGKNVETGDLKTFDMKDLQFAGKEISYEQQAESEDARGNKFFGIYEVTTVTADGLTWLFNHNNGNFKKYAGTSRTIDPMTGYLKTATEIDAFARITVVEEDGTVTAISTINADGEAVKADGWYTINGVKLQGMPTEKGVYIQNGKKVVLK